MGFLDKVFGGTSDLFGKVFGGTDDLFHKIFGGTDEILKGIAKPFRNTSKKVTLQDKPLVADPRSMDVVGTRADIVRRNIVRQSSTAGGGAAFIKQQLEGPDEEMSSGSAAIKFLSRTRFTKDEEKRRKALEFGL